MSTKRTPREVLLNVTRRVCVHAMGDAGSDDAVAVLRAAVRSEPWSASAYSSLGRELQHRGLRAEAVRALLLALALDPVAGEDSAKRLLDGGGLLLDNNGGVTIDAIKTISGLHPLLSWPHVALARFQAGRREHQVAAAHFQDALRLLPDDAQLWSLLASSYEALGKRAAARRALARSVELCCTDSTSADALCALLDEAAADELAAATFAREPRAVWAATRVVAASRRYSRLGDAIPALRTLLRVTPSDVHAWEELGAAYMASGRPGAALAACMESRRLAMDACLEPPAFASAAASLLAMDAKRPTDVEALAVDAERLSPDSVVVHSVLTRSLWMSACCWARLGALSLSRHASLRARATAESAVSCITGSASAAAWKALGDTTMEAARYPQNSGAPSSEADTRRACRAYAHAVHAAPNDGALWIDCSVATVTQIGLRIATTGLRVASAAGDQARSAEYWLSVASLSDSDAAQESALCHAIRLGGVAGARAATALARFYILRACRHESDAAALLAAAGLCLELARSAGGMDEASGWLATALFHGQRGNRDISLAALRSAVAASWDAESCARLACAMLSPVDAGQKGVQAQALAPACHAAAWRPHCTHSTAAMAGALAARGLYDQAGRAYALAALAAKEAGAGIAVTAALGDAERVCKSEHSQNQTAAAGFKITAMMCGKQLCKKLPAGRLSDAVAQHGALPAVIVAAVSSDLGNRACPLAQRLTDRKLVHAVPTLPAAYAHTIRDQVLGGEDGLRSAWALWTHLHEVASAQVTRRASGPTSLDRGCQLGDDSTIVIT